MVEKQSPATEIVNRGSPHLVVKTVVRATISCPNCSSTMQLDVNDVDIGHIVKCGGCKKLTYYPFERPWYRRRKLVLGFIASIVFSFLLGLAVNYTYDRIKAPKDEAGTPPESKK